MLSDCFFATGHFPCVVLAGFHCSTLFRNPPSAGPSSTCRAFFCLPDFSQLEWYVKPKDVDLADRRKFPANLKAPKSPWTGVLAACRIAKRFCNPSENPRRTLPANLKAPKSPWMGDLAACRIAKRFCNPSENPWRDFLKAECRPKNLKIP